VPAGVAVHLIGNSGGSVLAIEHMRPFHATLRVRGAAAPDGTLASARVACPRKGCVDGTECIDCVHLQAWRATPELRLYCSVDDSESVTSWMRTHPPATTVDTRCPAADEFAAARGVHHLLVFDRLLELAGIICRCDLAHGAGRPVGEVMTTDVFAIDPSTSLGVAAAAMRELHIGCLPVVRGALVLGILTRRDLDRAGVPR
jgi:CBS-domain-containing membrane protein